MTTTSAANLRKAMRELRELPATANFNPAVLPWASPDRESYLLELARHHTAVADAGDMTNAGKLQLQYDLINLDRRVPRVEDILTNLGIPCMLPVYEHQAITDANLTSPQALRLIERANLLPQGAMDRQFYLSPIVHHATVRTDPERKRISNNGVLHPPGLGDTTTVAYRSLALWRPDAWHPVYGLWHQYGRENLLNFPGQGQPR